MDKERDARPREREEKTTNEKKQKEGGAPALTKKCPIRQAMHLRIVWEYVEVTFLV